MPFPDDGSCVRSGKHKLVSNSIHRRGRGYLAWFEIFSMEFVHRWFNTPAIALCAALTRYPQAVARSLFICTPCSLTAVNFPALQIDFGYFCHGRPSLDRQGSGNLRPSHSLDFGHGLPCLDRRGSGNLLPSHSVRQRQSRRSQSVVNVQNFKRHIVQVRGAPANINTTNPSFPKG